MRWWQSGAWVLEVVLVLSASGLCGGLRQGGRRDGVGHLVVGVGSMFGRHGV